jgi:hypothetical protein
MKKRRGTLAAYLIGALLVVLLAILAAGRVEATQASPASPASQGTPVPYTHQPTGGPVRMTIVVDGIAVPLGTACRDQGFAAPRLIIDATTASTSLASHWNTPNGLKPANFSTKHASPFSIVTPLRFAQMRIIADGRKAPTSEMVTLGGQVGQDQILVVGLYPHLLPNQHYLLFLDPGMTAGQLFVGEAFRVVGPDTVVAQEQSLEQGKVTQPEVTMSLAKVEAQLQASCHY